MIKMFRKYSQDEAQALVKALKGGNQLAFSIVYKMYAAQTFSLAFKYLQNKELAEDAVQNLFLKLWLKKEEIDETKPINIEVFVDDAGVEENQIAILQDRNFSIRAQRTDLHVDRLIHVDVGDFEFTPFFLQNDAGAVREGASHARIEHYHECGSSMFRTYTRLPTRNTWNFLFYQKSVQDPTPLTRDSSYQRIGGRVPANVRRGDARARGCRTARWRGAPPPDR